ncbi:hypothetical protein BBC27_05930 [Acidithiobacillus ferrivorans]|uniref:Glycosyltransferase subfamily 4-like N-terminal domain-containing protein n=1 Tax=Acidithiobacillus ferrivorans TaxID=160808 RepID=A0A1B9C1R3_9PROT|nr:glycosyltransferase [Acidithiobacillus ferrivorans]OCB03881.1 hypothetical protein BBC27_05930 [Acidithiobacillus ferrivorans]
MKTPHLLVSDLLEINSLFPESMGFENVATLPVFPLMDGGAPVLGPLRVAVDANTLSGRLAGIGHYSVALCQQLVADGGATLAYFTARSWAPEPPRPAGLRIPQLLQWRKHIPLGRELQWALQGRQLARLERRWRPDLILGSNFVLPPGKAPSVLVVHDLSHIRYPEVHPPARVTFLNGHLRPALAQARAVLTDSCFTEAELLHYFPEAAGRTHAAQALAVMREVVGR